ncbi:MAG: hypothetical protein FD153_1249, partial [Rhodospirillaceae bacterium]
ANPSTCPIIPGAGWLAQAVTVMATVMAKAVGRRSVIIRRAEDKGLESLWGSPWLLFDSVFSCPTRTQAEQDTEKNLSFPLPPPICLA